MRGRGVQLVGLAAVAVTLAGCSFQFAIGRDIHQAVEVNPLAGMIGVLIAASIFMLALAALGSGGMGPER